MKENKEKRETEDMEDELHIRDNDAELEECSDVNVPEYDPEIECENPFM